MTFDRLIISLVMRLVECAHPCMLVCCLLARDLIPLVEADRGPHSKRPGTAAFIDCRGNFSTDIFIVKMNYQTLSTMVIPGAAV